MIEIQNKKVTDWVAECAAMTKPKEIVWIDGSEAQLDAIRALAVETGEMVKLNEEKLPGCYYYRTDPKDVARDEKRTVICTTEEKDAGPTNNWVQKDEMYAKMRALFDGSMEGRTMYVIPYSMGVVGSPFSKIGIEITDSIYVVLSMHIMTRIGDPVIEELNKGADFVKCLHSRQKSTPKRNTSRSSRRKTPSGASTPLTAATSCSARNALPCVSALCWVSARAGWRSIC